LLELRFLRESNREGFVVIGSVFLVVTGAEALFGLPPSRVVELGLQVEM